MKEFHTTLLFIGFAVAIWPLSFWRFLTALWLFMALVGILTES